MCMSMNRRPRVSLQEVEVPPLLCQRLLSITQLLLELLSFSISCPLGCLLSLQRLIERSGLLPHSLCLHSNNFVSYTAGQAKSLLNSMYRLVLIRLSVQHHNQACCQISLQCLVWCHSEKPPLPQAQPGRPCRVQRASCHEHGTGIVEMSAFALLC